MRLEEHLALSTAAALVALPWLKEEIWLPYAASILIDVDHYVAYAMTQHRLDPRAALRYLKRPLPGRRRLPKPFHHPLLLLLLTGLALCTRSRRLWLLLAGMLFHISLDAFNNGEVRRIQRSLQQEANGHCPQCGQPCHWLELHAVAPTRTLLTRYRRTRYVVLCPACHHAAHGRSTAQV
jgi:hypothetical protein